MGTFFVCYLSNYEKSELARATEQEQLISIDNVIAIHPSTTILISVASVLTEYLKAIPATAKLHENDRKKMFVDKICVTFKCLKVIAVCVTMVPPLDGSIAC